MDKEIIEAITDSIASRLYSWKRPTHNLVPGRYADNVNVLVYRNNLGAVWVLINTEELAIKVAVVKTEKQNPRAIIVWRAFLLDHLEDITLEYNVSYYGGNTCVEDYQHESFHMADPDCVNDAVRYALDISRDMRYADDER